MIAISMIVTSLVDSHIYKFICNCDSTILTTDNNEGLWLWLAIVLNEQSFIIQCWHI